MNKDKQPQKRKWFKQGDINFVYGFTIGFFSCAMLIGIVLYDMIF